MVMALSIVFGVYIVTGLYIIMGLIVMGLYSYGPTLWAYPLVLRGELRGGPGAFGPS